MTVEERLRHLVDQMTEDGAEAMMRRIDEPVGAEEVAVVAEVDLDRARGVPSIPFDEIKRR
jgi:hypothetical protein